MWHYHFWQTAFCLSMYVTNPNLEATIPVRDRPDVQRLTAELLRGARSDETREALKDSLDKLHQIFERWEQGLPGQR